jgi:hypothetical protein
VPRLVDAQHARAITGDLPVADRSPSAQDRLDPQHELPRAERLRDVVVGAEFQAPDPVLLAALGGQHQDRNRDGGTELAGHRFSRDVGQTEIQDHQIRVGLRRHGDGLGAGPGRKHGETRALQVCPDEIPQLPLVLYH